MILSVILIGGLLYAMAASGMWFFAGLLIERLQGMSVQERQRRALLIALLWPLSLVFFGHASVKQAAVDAMSR
jgi:hypothetical protein